MKPPSCNSCPLVTKSKGFVLDWGDPEQARIMLQLEAPGTSELLYRVERDELVRRRDYYSLPAESLATGSALVGKSWSLLESWVLRGIGLTRRDLYISNTIRCLAPLRNGSAYPVGKERKAAEAACRQYDLIDRFKPDLFLIGPHPAAIFRDLALLPILKNVFRKAAGCVRSGYRPCVLLGEKAISQRLGQPYATVRKLHGHYVWGWKP